MKNEFSILNNETITFYCSCCDYTFEFKYHDLKKDETLIFCPLCYTEKLVSPKDEITSYLMDTINNLNALL